VNRAGRLACGALLVAALAGCGNDAKQSVTTTAPQMVPIRVFYLRAGKVQPLRRFVAQTSQLPVAALAELVAGPTAAERKDLLLSSAVHEIEGVAVSGSVVHIPGFDRSSLAQIVYTATQFPTVHAVAVGAERYTRADFEAETPAILVESPLADEQVKSPLRITGTANTFEATFQYELVDSAGKVIAKHFVTATSGSGTRGTFDVTIPYPAGHAGRGKLVVYESSAKDGSRIHVVEIPVRLAR
jgi:hypothetical protein